MSGIEAFVDEVDRALPRWYDLREEALSDLRRHLLDRTEAGESEDAVLRDMGDPRAFAAAIMASVPLSPAPLALRFAAFFVDLVLGLPLTILGFSLLGLLVRLLTPNAPPGMWGLWRMWLETLWGSLAVSPLLLLFPLMGFLALSVFILSILYFPLAEGVWGTTIGKRAFGLCVVSDDGTRLTWGRAVARRIPFLFEFFWLDALAAPFTRRRQRAFDLVAGTLVIRRPKPGPVPSARTGASRGGLPYALALLFLLAAMPVSGQQPDIGSAPGRLVDIGGRRLHLYCTGEGSPTVILESGASSFAIDWWLVQPEIAATNRVCSYDRAGYGWSDAGDGVETPAGVVGDLYALLNAAGEPPPYVLVGASMGGIYARLYQLRHPEEIVGMVLVDPAHEDDLWTMLDGNPVTIASLTPDQVKTTVSPGMQAVSRPSPQTGEPFDRLPANLYRVRVALEERLIDTFPDSVSSSTVLASVEGQRSAFAELHAAMAREVTPLAELPLVVLTRGDARPGLLAVHEELAKGSHRSRHTQVADSGHEIHLYRPDVVVQAIVEVLAGS